MNKIPHSKPTIGAQEAEMLKSVLESGFHARGPECQAFERELADYLGLKAAHTCASGSGALVLAQRALGLKDGARILTPSLACAAVGHAVLEADNEIVLYDGGYEMPTQAEVDNFPDADGLLLVAPMEGWSGPLPNWRGGPTILDRCQQLSADAPAQRDHAALEVFSFYATKCISTGSGGALASAHPQLMAIAAELNAPDKQRYWRAERFNFGFDDLRASMGRAQLEQLPAFIARRREIATRYADSIGTDVRKSGINFRFLVDCGDKLANAKTACTEAGIDATRPVFGLLHRVLGLGDGAFPVACAAWQRYLSVPLYPALDEAAVERVCAVLRGITDAPD